MTDTFAFYAEPDVIAGDSEARRLFAGLGECDGAERVCIGIDECDRAVIFLDRDETVRLIDTLIGCVAAMESGGNGSPVWVWDLAAEGFTS